jgi:hypothetical protein
MAVAQLDAHAITQHRQVGALDLEAHPLEHVVGADQDEPPFVASLV